MPFTHCFLPSVCLFRQIFFAISIMLASHVAFGRQIDVDNNGYCQYGNKQLLPDVQTLNETYRKQCQQRWHHLFVKALFKQKHRVSFHLDCSVKLENSKFLSDVSRYSHCVIHGGWQIRVFKSMLVVDRQHSAFDSLVFVTQNNFVRFRQYQQCILSLQHEHQKKHFLLNFFRFCYDEI